MHVKEWTHKIFNEDIYKTTAFINLIAPPVGTWMVLGLAKLLKPLYSKLLYQKTSDITLLCGF